MLNKYLLFGLVFLLCISSCYALTITSPLNNANISYNTTYSFNKSLSTSTSAYYQNIYLNGTLIGNLLGDYVDGSQGNLITTTSQTNPVLVGNISINARASNSTFTYEFASSSINAGAYYYFHYSDGSVDSTSAFYNLNNGCQVSNIRTFTVSLNKTISYIEVYGQVTNGGTPTGVGSCYYQLQLENTIANKFLTIPSIYSIINNTGNYILNISSFNYTNGLIESKTINVSMPYNSLLNISAVSDLSIQNFNLSIQDMTTLVINNYTINNYNILVDVIRGNNYTLTGETGLLLFSPQTQNILNAYNLITLSTFGLTNCSPNINVTGLTLFYFDENNPYNSLNASANIQINSTSGNYSVFNTFSLPYASSHRLCLTNGQSITAQSYIQYTSSPGYTNRYYIYNTNYDSSAKSILLYDWSEVNVTGTGLLNVIFRDPNTWNPLQNKIVQLQRNYVGEGVWRTVQEDLTDYTGTGYFHVIQLNTDYRLLLYDLNNNLLYQSDTLKFSCDIYGVCSITVITNQAVSSLNTGTNIVVTPTYNNNTNIITTAYSDPLGANDNIQILVQTSNTTHVITICSSTLSGSSGTQVCNITGYSGQIKVNTYNNGNLIYSAWVDASATTLGKLIGAKESAFWTFAICCLMVGAGFISPVLSIILLVGGLIFIFLMGLFAPLNVLVLTIICVISVVIAVKLKE